MQQYHFHLLQFSQKEESEAGDTLFATAEYGSRMGVAGLTHTLLLGANNFLYTTLSMSGNGSGVDYLESPAPGESPLVLRHENDMARSTMRATSTLNTRINANHKLRTGVIVSADRFRSIPIRTTTRTRAWRRPSIKAAAPPRFKPSPAGSGGGTTNGRSPAACTSCITRSTGAAASSRALVDLAS